MLTLNALKLKRDSILSCAKRNGASAVRVFGSVARGEAGENSDVDFLVDFERSCTLLDEARLIIELAELLGVEVDVVSEEEISPYIRDKILREAVLL